MGAYDVLYMRVLAPRTALQDVGLHEVWICYLPIVGLDTATGQRDTWSHDWTRKASRQNTVAQPGIDLEGLRTGGELYPLMVPDGTRYPLLEVLPKKPSIKEPATKTPSSKTSNHFEDSGEHESADLGSPSTTHGTTADSGGDDQQ